MKDVSFDVADGEFCILLGPSGCGKTTLLRLVAGLEHPSSGVISLGDRRIDGLPPQKRDVAFVFQSYALYPHMNAYENMAFSLRLRRLPEEEIGKRVAEAARLLDIEGQLQRRPQELSGGQRQRVAVGRAIVRQPKAFLFDEPLSNLDASLRATMRVELARLHRKLRATVLYVTHDQSEALTLGEKVIVLHEGKIQQIGSPAVIYHRPANTFVGCFVGSPQMNLIEGNLEAGGVLRSGDLRLDLSAALKDRCRDYAGRALTVGIRPEDLHPARREEAWFHGEVELVEDLGSDCFIHVKGDGQSLVARASHGPELRPGEPISLRTQAEKLHLFFQGSRIE